MKLIDLFEKIQMGYDDLPPTIWYDFIKRKTLDYDIVLECEGVKICSSISSIVVDDKSNNIIFNIELSDIDKEIENDIAEISKKLYAG